MTVKELAAVIGTIGALDARSQFSPQVEIMDAKTAYGQVRYLVRPVAGTGMVWVEAARVTA